MTRDFGEVTQRNRAVCDGEGEAENHRGENSQTPPLGEEGRLGDIETQQVALAGTRERNESPDERGIHRIVSRAESHSLEARRGGLTLAEATRLLEQGWTR